MATSGQPTWTADSVGPKNARPGARSVQVRASARSSHKSHRRSRTRGPTYCTVCRYLAKRSQSTARAGPSRIGRSSIRSSTHRAIGQAVHWPQTRGAQPSPAVRRLIRRPGPAANPDPTMPARVPLHMQPVHIGAYAGTWKQPASNLSRDKIRGEAASPAHDRRLGAIVVSPFRQAITACTVRRVYGPHESCPRLQASRPRHCAASLGSVSAKRLPLWAQGEMPRPCHVPFRGIPTAPYPPNVVHMLVPSDSPFETHNIPPRTL